MVVSAFDDAAGRQVDCGFLTSSGCKSFTTSRLKPVWLSIVTTLLFETMLWACLVFIARYWTYLPSRYCDGHSEKKETQTLADEILSVDNPSGPQVWMHPATFTVWICCIHILSTLLKRYLDNKCNQGNEKTLVSTKVVAYQVRKDGIGLEQIGFSHWLAKLIKRELISVLICSTRFVCVQIAFCFKRN